MVRLDTDSPGEDPIRVIFISFYVVAKELDLNVSLWGGGSIYINTCISKSGTLGWAAGTDQYQALVAP